MTGEGKTLAVRDAIAATACVGRDPDTDPAEAVTALRGSRRARIGCHHASGRLRPSNQEIETVETTFTSPIGCCGLSRPVAGDSSCRRHHRDHRAGCVRWDRDTGPPTSRQLPLGRYCRSRTQHVAGPEMRRVTVLIPISRRRGWRR